MSETRTDPQADRFGATEYLVQVFTPDGWQTVQTLAGPNAPTEAVNAAERATTNTARPHRAVKIQVVQGFSPA